MLAQQVLQMQPAALIMLSIILATTLIFLPREVNFLRRVEEGWRRQFITQDALIMACILIVLLPCALTPRLSLQILTVVVVAFTVLWVVVIWAAFARYSYIRKILKDAHEEGEQKLRELIEEKRRQEEQDNG